MNTFVRQNGSDPHTSSHCSLEERLSIVQQRATVKLGFVDTRRSASPTCTLTHDLTPLKCSGIRRLRLKSFNAIQV